ncbi:MAG: class I SAM-dependent methyltransferase [Gammaproteobacteria bacterium]|nr:class I SAM-dependent methyltransferase [Gammaproteobacteria bacterium]MBU2395762.1 class I SAM-dependent methyltransferase [Gammaproteobacteria bacterium]
MQYFKYISKLIESGAINIDTIRSYLEIGVCEGNSVKAMVQEFPLIEKIVLSDTWGDTYGGSNQLSHDHIEDQLEDEGFDLDNVIFLDGDSKETLPLYFSLSQEEVFDLIFIDGDHSIEGATEDLANCIDHCRICAFHDVRHPAHPYLLGLCYWFYDIIKEDFIMIDDGEYLIYFIKKDLFDFDS